MVHLAIGNSHFSKKLRSFTGRGNIFCISACADGVHGFRTKCKLSQFTHGVRDHPTCYSAFRRGIVISAMLYRSPDSSDCAFILSDAPCPVVTPSPLVEGLARRFLPQRQQCRFFFYGILGWFRVVNRNPSPLSRTFQG